MELDYNFHPEGSPYERVALQRLNQDLASLTPEVGPVELCSMWFDDLYRPGEQRPELSNPEGWARASRVEIVFFQ